MLNHEELQDLCVVGCVYVGVLVFCVSVYASVMCLGSYCCEFGIVSGC